jgi:hypothetical protein
MHVFMCKILANMTQVSDVAPGPLVLMIYASSFLTFVKNSRVAIQSVHMSITFHVTKEWSALRYSD